MVINGNWVNSNWLWIVQHFVDGNNNNEVTLDYDRLKKYEAWFSDKIQQQQLPLRWFWCHFWGSACLRDVAKWLRVR